MKNPVSRFTLAALAAFLVIPALAAIPQSEHDALMALYNATGGPNWAVQPNGWGGALGTESTWLGVELDAGETTVVGLDLTAWGLTGTLPGDIGNLPNLTYLYLSSNELNGPLPSQLGSLTKLVSLDLSLNALTGNVPSAISGCTALKECVLFGNMLSGTVPAQIGSLVQLDILDLSGNKLTGAVPPELGSLTVVRYLRLNGNALAGELPSQLTNLTALVDDGSGTKGGLDLRYNALTTTNAILKDFLDGKQEGGNWTSYQTVTPGGLTILNPTSTSLEASWDTIDYTDDSGYYEVFKSTTAGGPYTSCGGTSSKTEGALVITGLSPNTTYHFVVTAVTTADNVHNQNTITSGYSTEASGTTQQGAEPLTVKATANPTSGGAPLEVQFTCVPAGGTPPYSYSWTFGDGGTSTDAAPKHTYAATGTYAVGLTVTDAQSQKASDNSLSITVAPPCTLTCTATVPPTAPPGTEVSFTGQATATGCAGTPTFAWAFGDGSTSTEQNPKHTYAAAGNYVWSMGVTAGDKVCTQTGTIEVLLPPAIASLKKMGNPFRIKITGSNFQTGAKVTINGTEWTNLKLKGPTEILLKGGGSLKAAVPKNTATQFKVKNPDGGEATMTWQWP